MGDINWVGIALGGLDLLLFLRWKVSIPKVILLNAAAGLLLFGVIGL